MGARRKTIKRVIRTKLEEWIDTIKDEDVARLAYRDSFVTGGAIASLLLGNAPKDFDVYFRTKEAALAVANYYVKVFQEKTGKAYTITVGEYQFTNINGELEDRVGIKVSSAGVAGQTETDVDEQMEVEELAGLLRGSNNEPASEPTDEGYAPTFLSQNAITLSNKVQLIIRFFGTPDEIHKNYDFVHCQNWYDLKMDHLELKPEAMESILSKSLVYTGSLYPICSILRVRKFIQREWKINAGQILKMAMQCKKIDFTDPKVLADQLNGCDSHYFSMLIRAMHETDSNEEGEAKPRRDLSETYVTELIDRIFSQ